MVRPRMMLASLIEETEAHILFFFGFFLLLLLFLLSTAGRGRFLSRCRSGSSRRLGKLARILQVFLDL